MARTLTRPMFRKGGMAQREKYMGGGIKTIRPKYMGGGMTGIMSGIVPDAGLTPRVGYQEGTYQPKDYESIVAAENIGQIFDAPFLDKQFRKEYLLDNKVISDPGQFQFQYMTPDRYLPKEKSLERADILENPEAYEFYKKKYIEKEYSDKIKKQKEILKKAEDKRIANIYGSEKLETDTPGKGDPGMFLKPKKKETNLDDVPSDKETVKDYIDMFKSALSDEEDSEKRNKYLALAQFGANLLSQTRGDIVGAVGKASTPAIQTLGKAMSDRRDAERQAKLLGTQAYLKSIEPGALRKQINDLMALGYTKQGAITKIVDEGRGTATRESTQVTKRENLAKELNEEGIPPRQAGDVAGKILASKVPDYNYSLLPDDPVEGEYYYNKKGDVGKYVIKNGVAGLDDGKE